MTKPIANLFQIACALSQKPVTAAERWSPIVSVVIFLALLAAAIWLLTL